MTTCTRCGRHIHDPTTAGAWGDLGTCMCPPPAVPSVAGDEAPAPYGAFKSLGPMKPEVARKIAVEWELHPPYRDDVRWLSDSYLDALSRVALLRERAERAEKERDERRWMEDGGTWEDRAKAAEARASAAEAESERLRGLIGSAAPLTWVATRDMAGAKAWEDAAGAALSVGETETAKGPRP